MDILSLQAKTAVLTRGNSHISDMKVDKEKIKKDLSKLRDKEEIKDLTASSDKLDISKLNISGSVKIISNYSTDIFFNNDELPKADSEGNYEINGTKFTSDEVKEVKRVINAAIEGCGVGIGKNINIDYRNYAQMSLAENIVNKYAKGKFTDEQQEVISKAMKSYNSAIEKLQRDYLSENEHTKNNYGEISNYYSLSNVLNQNDADALNKLKNELSKITKQKYPLSKAGDAYGFVHVATNEDLINDIKDLFSNVDIANNDEVALAMNRYKELMIPVYRADDSSNRSAQNRANSDISAFKNMLNNLSTIQSYTGVSFSV